MRVITINVNGIRAAARKGFFEWLPRQMADVVCLQETKAQMAELGDSVFRPEGYRHYFLDALRKGYSGVGLYCRREPEGVVRGLGFEDIDAEARYLEVRFPRLSVVSLYVPSGSSSPERQAAKFSFMERFETHLRALRDEPREYIICGDWNIAHKPIDLRNWRANQKNSGFLPEERHWLDRVYDHLGFVDAFRVVSQEPDQYTWWSNRGQAWAKNVGWRLDYQVVTPGIADRPRRVAIFKDQRFSDHAPLTIDYDLADLA